MGKAVELIVAQAIAPGVGGAFLAAPGNSLTVRDSTKPVWLGPVWQSRQLNGFLRMTSPLLHDSTVGIQMQAPFGQTVTLEQDMQQLYPQDSIVLFGSGSAVAGDIEQMGMLWIYEDLPGVEGYFITAEELQRRGEDIYSFPNTLATGTVGGYSGVESVVSEVDQLKANRDYAIVGYELTVAACAIRYTSSDWGNLGVGGPGPVDPTSGAMQTRTWFRDISERWRMPLIPVFNSSNKALTFVDAAQNENGGDPVVTTIAVILSGTRGRTGGKRQ